MYGLLLAAAGGCTDSHVADGPQFTNQLVRADIDAVSLAVDGDGEVLWAQRSTGVIRRLSDGTQVARVEVGAEGQRGLLGLAVGPGDEVYAAWTDPSNQLVVGQVAPGATRIIWAGFVSATGANGGRLAMAPDGRLVLGVGTIRQSDRVADPGTPNGKMLAIDPAGPPSQNPETLSSGWNNPFGFAFTDAGQLWVADNHPSDGEERLARGDLAGASVDSVPHAVLPFDSAPSGVAAVAGRIYVCSFTTGSLYRYEMAGDASGGGGIAQRAGTVADDCRFDVVAMPDGSLLYLADDEIRRIEGH